MLDALIHQLYELWKSLSLTQNLMYNIGIMDDDIGIKFWKGLYR